MPAPPLSYIVYATILAHDSQGKQPVASQACYAHLISQGVTLPDGALEAALMELRDRGRIAVTRSPDLNGVQQHGALLIRQHTDDEQPIASQWEQFP